MTTWDEKNRDRSIQGPTQTDSTEESTEHVDEEPAVPVTEDNNTKAENLVKTLETDLKPQDASDKQINAFEPIPNLAPSPSVGSVPSPLTLLRATATRLARFTQAPGAYPVAGPNLNPQTLGNESVSSVDNSSEEPTAAFPAELVPCFDTESVSDVSVGVLVETQQAEGEGDLVVEGQAIKEANCSGKLFYSFSFTVIVLMGAVATMMALGLSGVFDDDEAMFNLDQTDDNAPSMEESISTLEQIRRRGVLRAAITIFPEMINEEGELQTRDPVLVRAIAAGILGPAGPVEFVDTPMKDLFSVLANGTVDIMLYGATHTMERSVYLESEKSNFAFSIPYMFGGIQAAGDPFYVNNCADKGMKHLNECKGLQVCVLQDSTHYEALRQHLPERHIVPQFWDNGGAFHGYLSGECNVLVDTGALFSPFYTEHVLMMNNGTKLPDNFTVGTIMFSNEPSCAVTRTDDPIFSDFVSAIINGLIAAESRGITQDIAGTYPEVTAFGQEYKDMMRHAVASSGNYAEFYNSQVEIVIPRQPLNTVNSGDTGLLYPHPYGILERGRNGKPLGPLLTKILQRGRLHCGISVDRPGFAIRLGQGYSGMEVDFCRAISASLFQGDDSAVDFVDIQQPSDGFALLADGTLDVLAGVTWTLQNDVREPSTGIGYSFSEPYFYGYSPEQDNLCLATRQEDSDWSNFVYWVLTGTLSAEYSGIDSMKSSSMPEVFVFGAEFKRMFRDSILIVGNYADIYERHLQTLIPRGGRNVLNRSGPQHYVLPGII